MSDQIYRDERVSPGGIIIPAEGTDVRTDSDTPWRGAALVPARRVATLADPASPPDQPQRPPYDPIIETAIRQMAPAIIENMARESRFLRVLRDRELLGEGEEAPVIRPPDSVTVGPGAGQPVLYSWDGAPLGRRIGFRTGGDRW